MKNSQLTIPYSLLKTLTLIYISLPLFCFFIGWLQWLYAVLACLALTICILFSCGNRIIPDTLFKRSSINSKEDFKGSQFQGKELILSKKVFISIAIISLLYCFLCGIGRLWAQSLDYPYRNAVLRDLILRDWPVLYDKFNGALSYYIGFWLPAAIPGKIVYMLSGDPDTAFRAGNIFLLIYSSIGIVLLFLLILLYFKRSSAAQIYLIIFGFIFFSGMDILGPKFSNWHLHLEWWAAIFQYSSFTTCLCWVFNQTVIPLLW